MKTAIKLTTEGIASLIDLSADSNELLTLQVAVGGLIEAKTLKDGYTLIMNEEGKLEQLAINHRATEIWLANFPNFPDVIVGNVVIAGGYDEDGEQLGLDSKYANKLLDLFSQE